MAGTLSTRMSQALEPWFGRGPFAALQRDMDDLMARFSAENGGDWLTLPFVPTLDLSESNGSLMVRVDLPGIRPDDIDIEVRGTTLRISGERTEEEEEKTYYRVERRYGSFARTVELPCEIREDQVKAEYHDGILTVRLPKSEAAKSHKIE